MKTYNVKLVFSYPLINKIEAEYVFISAKSSHDAYNEAMFKYSPDGCEVIGIAS